MPVAHPELEASFLYPGAFAKFSATPIETFRRPPLLGEHTDEVLRELNADGTRVRSEAAATPPPTVSATQRRAVFDGLKIVDFTWAAAGPITTRHFGDYGATVVKIESQKHPGLAPRRPAVRRRQARHQSLRLLCPVQSKQAQRLP